MMPATTWIQRNTACRVSVFSMRSTPLPGIAVERTYQASPPPVNRRTARTKGRSPRRGERERHLRGALRGKAHARLAHAEALVPGGDDVVARRDVGEREAAVGAGHGEVRVVEDADPALHPGMEVAADAHHHLGRLDPERAAAAPDRHGEVPRARLLRGAVDVVERRIVVDELDGLSDLRPDDARAVDAPALVDHDRRGRHRKDAVAEAELDVDEGVLDEPVVHEGVARRHRPLVLLAAPRPARERQRAHGRGCSLEADHAADGAGRGVIERRRRPRRWVRLLLGRPAARRERDRGQERDPPPTHGLLLMGALGSSQFLPHAPDELARPGSRRLYGANTLAPRGQDGRVANRLGRAQGTLLPRIRGNARCLRPAEHPLAGSRRREPRAVARAALLAGGGLALAPRLGARACYG